MKRVVVGCALDSKAVAELKKEFQVVEAGPDRNKVLSALPADVLIARIEFPIDKEILGKVKTVIKATVGLDNVDMDAAKQLGVKVANVPEASVISVAELTVGLMLGLLRRIPLKDGEVRKGEWKRDNGNEIYGKTVGLVGFGRIPREVAKRLAPFGAKILAFDPFVDAAACQAGGAQKSELDALLSESDIVSLHVPLLDSTKHLINKGSLSKMKAGAVLINMARGGVVDTPALIDALKSGRLKAAALDVFEQEPYTGPLTGMDNVILSPHQGACTIEAQDRIADEVVRIVRGIK